MFRRVARTPGSLGDGDVLLIGQNPSSEWPSVDEYKSVSMVLEAVGSFTGPFVELVPRAH